MPLLFKLWETPQKRKSEIVKGDIPNELDLRIMSVFEETVVAIL